MIQNNGRGTKIRGNAGNVLNDYTNITHALHEYLVTQCGCDESVVPKVIALCVKTAYSQNEVEVEQNVSEIQACLNGC